MGALGVTTLTSALAAAPTPTFRTVPCPADVRADRCGFVRVPEDHAQPGNGRTLDVFVAVKRGTQSAGRNAPLFYLEGGPGAPSSLSVGPLGQVFPAFDVVGIDQRGVGHSTPSLACPEVNTLMNASGGGVQSSEATNAQFTATLKACGARLRASGIRLEAFNTTQAAQDVDTVRRALGYGPVNLYGASYGTRLGQEVLRRAPGAVRAAVLDSVIPTTLDRVARSAESIQAALSRVFAACAADAACAAKYPNLEGTYRAVLKQLDARPLTLRVKGEDGPLDAQGFQALLLGSMYFTPGLEELPALIVAARDGDAARIQASFSVQFLETVVDTLTWGAFFSNECAGEVAYSTPERLRAALKAAPEFAGALNSGPGISSESIFDVCRAWGLAKPAPGENDAVVSSVPTLLLAGEFDPVTPAAWLPEAARGLQAAQTLVVRGAGHGSGLTSAAGYEAVVKFFLNPTAKLTVPAASTGKLNFR
ncbi:alpha/beta hydrolase fold protein [Deinococcus maricopensis DSM 21211]|uniref:Alpha/beta hydrolase fold protein n=1 Tax=Deinococcus maricopensis (strain DSM 21211 / LMG 22137 / NRRL B-23946 / LB-34) TaxID=709986 RepID=E8U7M3_DEIML|nr:alpha/beta hydrolase fold protein [Deinococcus maricopensis DSM 21211]